jgi:uncharacterized protein with FMN-binding domain
MRRITLWLFSTVAAVVLLFSYRTSTNSAASAQTVATAPLAPTTTGATPSPSASASGSASASPSASATSEAAKTYNGSVASTRWGDVQVTITVAGGKITDVGVPIYPSENGRDQEINAYALPTLRQETLDAQSASINTVSGATVTSDGYIQSLQAALDAAHLS